MSDLREPQAVRSLSSASRARLGSQNEPRALGLLPQGSFPCPLAPGRGKGLGVCWREERTGSQGAQGVPELQP